MEEGGGGMGGSGGGAWRELYLGELAAHPTEAAACGMQPGPKLQPGKGGALSTVAFCPAAL